MSLQPVYTKRFVRCPNGCDHEFEVEHMLDKPDRSPKAGPWYCEDCGDGWNLEQVEDFISMTKHHENQRPRRVVILEIPPQTEPIRFKLYRWSYGEKTQEERAESDRYFFDEHTCMTNWFSDVQEVYLGDEPDPHGLAQFVEARPLTAEEEAELEHGSGPVALNGAPGLNLERAREEAARRPN